MDEIVAAAARVFRAQGYADATLEDVAREVGINRATLYYYVADKGELLVEVVREPVARLTRELGEVSELDADPSEKLVLALRNHVRAFGDNYPHLFVFLAENLHMHPARNREILADAQRYGDLLTGIIEEGIDVGQFRADIDPRLSMLAVIGMCNWTHRWYREDGPNALEDIGEGFVELFLRGIVAPGAGRATAASRRALGRA
jgi:AcrR family transcriptional regulator